MKFAFPRPAAKEPDPPGVTIPESLVKSAKLASWLAFFSLVYFLGLYTLDIARDRAAALELNNVGPFVGLGLQFWFPYIIGFGMIAVGIPYVAKIAIPVFMSLRWKGQFYPKLWSLIIAVAVSLVVIAGTFTVQGEAVMEKGRDSAVKVEQIGQDRAAIEAQKQAAVERLNRLTAPEDDTPNMQQMAARAGEAAWLERIAIARQQDAPNLEAIERALPDAKRADAINKEIEGFTVALATAPTVASVQQRVETTGTGWIGRTIDWLEGARAMLLALVMDLVCLVMPWIALRLEQARKAQLDAAGPQVATVDKSHMLPDYSDHERYAPVTPQPMDPPMEAYDENGERMVFRKGHFAKKAARRGRSKEADKPVPHSDTDPRVVRAQETRDDEATRAPGGELVVGVGEGVFEPGNQSGDSARHDADAPVSGAVEQSSANEDGGSSKDASRAPETQDVIAPPLSQSAADEMVAAGTHEYVTDEHGDRWLREIERDAQQGAADEIGLGEDGKGGIMKPEKADG